MASVNFSSRERCGANDTAAFANRDDVVDRHVLQRVDPTGWPSHLEAVGARGGAESQVDPRIVLAEIARARLHLTHLGAPSGRETQPRPDAVAVALDADRTDDERVLSIAAVVAKKVGGLPVVRDQQIEVAVVVDVARCESTAHL